SDRLGAEHAVNECRPYGQGPFERRPACTPLAAGRSFARARPRPGGTQLAESGWRQPDVFLRFRCVSSFAATPRAFSIGRAGRMRSTAPPDPANATQSVKHEVA